MPLNEKKTLEKIKSKDMKSFDSLIDEIGVGVQTSADKIFIITDEEKNRSKIEDKILKRFIFGQSVRKWKIRWEKNYLIYPYYKKDGDSILIPENEFKLKFSNTYSYLLENKELLSERWGIKSWYELSTKRSFNWFEQLKILTAGTAHGSNFALDDSYSYYPKGGGGIFGITLKKKTERKEYIYILGLLNSKVIDFVFKHISPMLSGKHYTYHEDYLKRLPIKLPQTPEEERIAIEITERVERILALSKVEQRVEGFPDAYFEELQDEIEEWSLVKWIPRRNYKEVKIEIAGDLEGGRAFSFGKDDELREPAVDSPAKERYIVEALRGKRARKGEEIQIKLPRSDRAVEKIIERLEEDREELEGNPISRLEDEINEQVYQLYGLNENDVKVIEEFLEKF
jgi:hypothetical protein